MINPQEVERRKKLWEQGHWEIPNGLNTSEFNFDWRPDPYDRPYIHEFGTQWQKTGGPRFVIPDNEGVKYRDEQRAVNLPNADSRQWMRLNPDVEVDTSWHPDATEPPFIWMFGTEQYSAESFPVARYRVAGASEKKYSTDKVAKFRPLDIVYISNGESCAEENWQHLQEVVKDRPNRLVRVDGVDGRVAAYHAALTASETSWAFCVFAKLRVNPQFDWSWQPRHKDEPKHYIFYATNPVNGLEYGHQAMIAYNKQLVLSNNGRGLDFTLDNLNEVVPVNSGVATYNTSPWETWKTAFREVLKLKYYGDAESLQRLDRWAADGVGDYWDWSQQGVHDAIGYFNEVGGDFEKLKLSYEWNWLKTRFEYLYR
jgi:hypothetical protein